MLTWSQFDPWHGRKISLNNALISGNLSRKNSASRKETDGFKICKPLWKYTLLFVFCFFNFWLSPLHEFMDPLTHFWPMFLFYIPWKHQKILGFLVFLGVTIWEHWHKMGSSYVGSFSLLLSRFYCLTKTAIIFPSVTDIFVIRLVSIHTILNRKNCGKVKNCLWSVTSSKPHW